MGVVLAIVIVAGVVVGCLFRQAVMETEDPLEGGPEFLREPAVQDKVTGGFQGQQDVTNVSKVLPKVGVGQG